MRGRRKRLSTGTVVMLSLTVLVVVGTFAAMRVLRAKAPVEADAQTLRNAMMSVRAHSSVTPSPRVNYITNIVTARPAPVQTQTDVPDNVTRSFTLTAGGYVSFDSDILTAAEQSGKDAYLSDIFRYITGSVNADVSLAMYGNIISANVNGDVGAPEKTLQALYDCGFDTLMLGTQRALEEGLDGARRTLSAAEARGIGTFGLSDSQQIAGNIVKVNDIDLCILNYVESVSAASQAMTSDFERTYAVKLLSLSAVKTDIDLARALGADVVLVYIAWDNVGTLQPTTSQVEKVKQIVNLGADIVLGARSETMLPVTGVTVTNARGETKRVPVAYSLGTLLGENRQTGATSGALLHMRISYNDFTKELSITNMAYTPVYIWKQLIDRVQRFYLLPCTQNAPASMNAAEREALEKARTQISSLMQNSGFTQR